MSFPGQTMVLQGKVALVTGASRGIGRAIAEAFANAGADVAINFHSHPAEAEEVAAAVRAVGRRALLCPGDVADRAAVDQMVDQVVSTLGRVDTVVSNAAFSERELFFQADLEKFEQSIDVTMWGAFNVFRAAARALIAQGEGGALLGISSPHAYVPMARSMAYNMAKAALDQMARTAAVELIDHRIRVNLIHPGWIDTPGERRYASEAEIAAAGSKLPWQRLGRPDEIARAALFLCDPASDYITGASLLVDGGLTLTWGTRGK